MKLLIVFMLLIAFTAYAAWPYAQDFDGLSTADLNGQDSWSGSTDYDVQTGTVLQGTKSVENITFGEDNMVRDITSSTDGVIQYLFRRNSASTLDVHTQIADGNIGGTSAACRVTFNTSSAVTVQAVSVGAYSIDTNYEIDFEYDVSTDQCRARVDNGTWSDWANFDNTQTQITQIRFRNDNSAEVSRYWDDIKSGAAAAAGAPVQRRKIQPIFIN